MSKIKIKNFGPIKEGYQENDGWIDIKKVTVFIGNQGSGKSTVAKLISTFTWIEKALTRGDYDIKWFTSYNRFRKSYCSYHRLENYFFDLNKNDIASIEYRGDSYYMKYENGKLIIEESKNGDYPLPQIMYVPAERNFITNVNDVKVLRLTSDSLSEFENEFRKSKGEIKGVFPLPINNASVEYDKLKDIVRISGLDYRVRLTEASSGFQSLVPMYLVTHFLANSVKHQSENANEPMSGKERDRFRKYAQAISDDPNLSDEQKRITISEYSKNFNKTAFINIVEEPEQNLFPSSQRQMLNSLLEFNNMSVGNKLILTTHSPYIIIFLSIAIQGKYLQDKILSSNSGKELLEKLNKIVSLKSVFLSSDSVIYQLNESDGSIKKLPNSEGIPSDKNLLNNMIAEGNHLFDSLLEIEEEI
jgi:ABC-type ATPase involved in cell division